MMQKIGISGNVLAKDMKNVIKATEKADNKAKKERIMAKMASLEEQKAEMVKKNPALLAKTKEVAKGVKATTTIKTKEVTNMNKRDQIEGILNKLCKELKLQPPKRIAAMSTSKSGVGSFQAIGKCGGLKVAVRDHDIVVYSPISIIKQGKSGPGKWAHVTVLKATDDLTRAFKIALEDKKTGATWAKELGCMGAFESAQKATKKAKDEVKVAKGVKAAKAVSAKINKVSKKAIARVVATA